MSSVASDFLRLSLDIDNSIYGCLHVTVHGDFRRCKPMRRFLFEGDVVRFSGQNAVLFGVVRRDATEAMEPGVDDFREVRVQLLHQSGCVYRSVGELHFSFRVRTGSVIPGGPLDIYNET